MAIITVAREVAAFGEEVALEFSRLAGYRYVDRAHLEKRLEAMGIDPGHIARYDERRPGFWASISQERDDYIHYLKMIMFDEARSGDVVLVGRGSTCAFKGVPSAVAIKLVAPRETRVARVARSYSCDERHARKTVERSDHDREGFHRYFFDVDWKDASEYDLVMNSGDHPVETLAEALKAYVERVVSPEREASGRVRVEELSLACTIEHLIAYERRIPVHFLTVDVRNGVATLSGVANTHGAIDSAVAAAKEVSGVREVASAIQIVQEYTAMP
jgi:cytidylate kinase